MKKIFYPLFIIAALMFTTGCADTFYGAYNDLTGPVESIYLSPTARVYPAETGQLNAEVYPSLTANKSVTWSTTSGTGSVTVDQNGLITGVTTGTATVTATSKENSGISALCTVTIAPKYSLRDTGPGGGLVFYDKGSFSDGWRYMEAAPVSKEATLLWTDKAGYVGGLLYIIGKGKENTLLIYNWLTSPTSPYDSNIGNRAATFCLSVSNNTYTDWYLPSIDELQLMYNNLKLSSVGGFSNAFYWSSTESTTNGNAYGIYFNSGITGEGSKGAPFLLRPARRF